MLRGLRFLGWSLVFGALFGIKRLGSRMRQFNAAYG